MKQVESHCTLLHIKYQTLKLNAYAATYSCTCEDRKQHLHS